MINNEKKIIYDLVSNKKGSPIMVLMNDGTTEILNDIKNDFAFSYYELKGLSIEEATLFLKDTRNRLREEVYKKAKDHCIDTSILDGIDTMDLYKAESFLNEYGDKIERYITSEYFHTGKVFSVVDALEYGVNIDRYVDQYEWSELRQIVDLLRLGQDPENFIYKYDYYALVDIINALWVIEFYKDFDKDNPHYYNEDDEDYSDD